MIGKTVSHYRIIEKLGEGGMGIVYKAVDTTLDRTVALKCVGRWSGMPEDAEKRLFREARACASLNHPNITTIYEFFAAEGEHFIAMEFIEGETLRERIKDRPMTVQLALDIALQVVDGLSAAHDKCIIHRDLKSDNIMIDKAGRAKIMDFGLARLAEGSMLTKAGTTLGTAAYMSPEQVSSMEIDHRSDIYALGVILYEILTGTLPFEGYHELSLMYSIVNEDPRPPSDVNASIPPALEKAILKAMAKDLEDRYQSLAEMKTDLLDLHAVDRCTTSAATIKAGARKSLLHLLFAPYRGIKLNRVALGIPLIVIAAGAATYAIWRPFRTPDMVKALEYFHDGRLKRACREAMGVVRRDSTDSYAWNLLATINIRKKRFDTAITQNRTAIRLNPSNRYAYYNLAYALEETGELEEADVHYRTALTVDSTFVEAYSALGNLFIRRGIPGRAVEILRTALRIDPDADAAYLIHRHLGEAYIDLEKYDDAIRHLEESERLKPGVPETAEALQRANEKKDADYY